MAKIGLVMSWMRSGGTLLNQCLAALPDTIVLSEVHPKGGGGPSGSPRTVQEQAKAWYNVSLESSDYESGVLELADWCERYNKSLIVREYTVRNFNGATNNLVTYNMLKAKCDLKAFAFVRNPIDVMISWKNRDLSQASRVLAYASELVEKQIPIFHYEELCKNPEEQLRAICGELDVPFSSSFERYRESENVNGDVNFSRGSSRGYLANEIKPLPRKYLGKKQSKLLDQSDDVVKACRLLGYPPIYADPNVELESWLSSLTRRSLAANSKLTYTFKALMKAAKR